MEQIREYARSDVIVILTANKVDRPGREVTEEDGMKLADTYNLPYFETSARSGTNIQEAFTTIAGLVVQKGGHNAMISDTSRSMLKSVAISKSFVANRDTKCC
jgi:GTPase SAR1 family protein